MHVTIRLYRHHDLDLICLHESRQIKTRPTIYKLLKAYANQERMKIKIRKPEFPKKKIRNQIKVCLVLNEESDKDVIALLTSVHKGQRNSFIRNLLRTSLSESLLDSYFAYDNLFESQSEPGKKDEGIYIKKNISSHKEKITTEKKEPVLLQAENPVSKGQKAPVPTEHSENNNNELDFFDAFEGMLKSM